MTTLPAPLVPADLDLRDYRWMPLDVIALLNSDFNAIPDDTGWRCAVTLWARAWHQVPAGSLPDDDAALCNLAGLGRDVKTWKRIRTTALHGFVKCSDGRLYHNFLCGKAMEALENQKRFEERRQRDRDRKRARNSDGIPPECGSEKQPASVGNPMENAGTEQTGPDQNGTVKDSAAADEGAQDRDPIREALDSIEAYSDPNLHIHGARVLDWIKQGADLDLDIIPTLKGVLAKARKRRDDPAFMPASLNFFDQAVADAREARTRPLPNATTTGAASHGQTQTRPDSDEDLVARILERRGGSL